MDNRQRFTIRQSIAAGDNFGEKWAGPGHYRRPARLAGFTVTET